MKLKILLFLALFVAGVGASIALASPSTDGGGTGTTATSASGPTSTGTTTSRHGDDHRSGDGKSRAFGCRTVEVRATVTAGSVSLTLDASGKRVRSAVGTAATLAIPAGPARVKVKACVDAAGAQTLTLVGLQTASNGD